MCEGKGVFIPFDNTKGKKIRKKKKGRMRFGWFGSNIYYSMSWLLIKIFVAPCDLWLSPGSYIDPNSSLK